MERNRKDRALEAASYIESKREMVDKALDDALPKSHNNPLLLHEAMRYSVFAGGKRLRPILAIVAAETMGASVERALPVAVALECAHTYSLIHDDLPAMDDDDLRRGKPTLHQVYGEAIAILAGDALQAFAFNVLSTPEVRRIHSPDRLNWAIGELAEAIGPNKLVAGQAMDIMSEGKKGTKQDAEYIVLNKTAALIRASLTCGAILAAATSRQVEVFASLGEDLGSAFQIRDDILDLEGAAETLGKAVGKDQGRGKLTYPGVLGKEKAKKHMKKLLESAVEKAKTFGHQAEPLVGICEYVGNRVS